MEEQQTRDHDEIASITVNINQSILGGDRQMSSCDTRNVLDTAQEVKKEIYVEDNSSILETPSNSLILSPTLLWDEGEVESTEDEINSEDVQHNLMDNQYRVKAPKLTSRVTEEGWVNVYSSIGKPATIQQEENEDGYILIHTISSNNNGTVDQAKEITSMSRLEAAANSSTQCQCYEDEGQAYCLVIDNEDYSLSGLNIRKGSSRDANGIKDELEERNVTVKTVNNCTAHQIRSSLEELRNITGAMYRFLMIVILSHGFYGKIIGTDGKKISINNILEILSADNLPEFKNKPKILILHTCQQEEDNEADNDNHITMIEKHFLIALPTLPHCLAYRQPSRGTFYIQCFLKVLKEKGDTTNLLSMLTNVTGNLQKEIDAVMSGLTQTPLIITNLAGDVYLKRSRHKRLRDISCPSQSGSYCFIPSINSTEPLEMPNYNYQQNNTGASQARSALQSVVEESVLSENISCNGSLGRASSSNTRSENLEANTKEPMEIQEHINASGQPLPVYVASAASKSVEKYQCNTVAIEVSEAAAEKERSHSGISKATEPLAANGVVEPNKISQISQIDHEVLSPTLLWDDIETPNKTEGEKKEEEKEEEKEQLQDSTTVLHELLVQGTENEITIQTKTMEETQPQWIDVSGDHTDTPQSTDNEEDGELVNTLTVGNTSVLQSVITEEGYINIVNARREVSEREVDDWVVFDTT